mmetsp:Transcript_63442/g.138150  ORF Transcript_63442/g.138150 Transcript_63442/m.138150 type:complete len:81 (-) Transcript_63442:98-340(-)
MAVVIFRMLWPLSSKTDGRKASGMAYWRMSVVMHMERLQTQKMHQDQLWLCAIDFSELELSEVAGSAGSAMLNSLSVGLR